MSFETPANLTNGHANGHANGGAPAAANGVETFRLKAGLAQMLKVRNWTDRSRKRPKYFEAEAN
jgi:hypothetical protein